MGMVDLTKSFRRNRLEPGLRIFGFTGANFARRVDRAGAAALDLGEYAVLGPIDAGERKRIAGRDRIVAGADQPRYHRGHARDQTSHSGSATVRLRVRSSGGCEA